MTRQRLRRLIGLPYCLYAWLLTAIAVAFTLLGVALAPRAVWREWIGRQACRFIFLFSGCWPRVSGFENLPPGDCVVVANHASYVDGPLLKALLPARYSFVIKGEMRNLPVVHFLLRRAGARFVERFKHAESSRDARDLVRAARGGASLAFFPEGTFRIEPGVGQFRAGAFLAARKGNLTVVPVAIKGSRHMLTCGDWMVRPSRLSVEFLEPVTADHDAFGNQRQLAELARQRILAALGEPDLLAQPAPEYPD